MADTSKTSDRAMIWRFRAGWALVYILAIHGTTLSLRDRLPPTEAADITVLSVFADYWSSLLITNGLALVMSLLTYPRLAAEVFQKPRMMILLGGAALSILLGVFVLGDTLSEWSRYDPPLTVWQRAGWAMTHWLGIYIFVFLIPYGIKGDKV